MTESAAGNGAGHVPASSVRVESIGVNALDLRRVDVAVDITPCLEPLSVEMVIVGPGDVELSSIVLVDVRDWTLDKVMHLRRDATPGLYTLHVGLFHQDGLVHQAARAFSFPEAASGGGGE